MIGLETGSLFAGRYEVMRRIGAGGMGAVYLACDPNDREFMVALKLLYPGAIQSSQAQERFRNEITASYRVNHPNVVRAYEYFDAEDVQAYAMEYVDGGDLLGRMRSGAMSPDEACSILRQVSSALEAIHKAGIIHRDLKPENILITRKGVVKISDFGVARLKGSHTLTQADSMVGTPKYLAPEYVETGECDGRGDVFAVGVIGYELVSGTSPFGKDFKPNQVMERITMEIPPLLEVAPSCPPELARIIEKAMSIKLHQRYQSAADLRADLERFERGDAPEVAKAAPTPEINLSTPQSDPDPVSMKTWGDGAQSRPQPTPETARGFGFGDVEIPPTTPAWREKVPMFAAAGALFFLVVALGFTSALLLNKPSPLEKLPPGIYQGMITGMSNSAANIPLGVWTFKDRTLALVGLDGCAANNLMSNGSYECGPKTFKFTVLSVSPEGASGTVKLTTGGTAFGDWSITRTNAARLPNVETNTPKTTEPEIAPPITTQRKKPVTARQENQSEQKLKEIEAKLRDGDASPEDAARSLLNMGTTSNSKEAGTP